MDGFFRAIFRLELLYQCIFAGTYLTQSSRSIKSIDSLFKDIKNYCY